MFDSNKFTIIFAQNFILHQKFYELTKFHVEHFNFTGQDFIFR